MREFIDYLKSDKTKVWRFLVYKRMFTPYEQDRKFVDESEFADIHYTLGTIENAWVLPDGDILIEFRTYKCLTELHKLSEIKLSTKDEEEMEDFE